MTSHISHPFKPFFQLHLWWIQTIMLNKNIATRKTWRYMLGGSFPTCVSASQDDSWTLKCRQPAVKEREAGTPPRAAYNWDFVSLLSPKPFQFYHITLQLINLSVKPFCQSSHLNYFWIQLTAILFFYFFFLPLV